MASTSRHGRKLESAVPTNHGQKSGQALPELVDDYLMDRRAAGLSLKTINDTYGLPLRRYFLPFCEAEGIADADQVDQRLLNKFGIRLQDGLSLRGTKLSPFSVNSYLQVVNLFLAWAARQGEMEDLRAHQPRLPKRVLQVLSRSEIELLEDTAKNERDKVIVRVLADTGVRVSELLGLTPDDLLQRGGEYLIKVTGKGDRDRLVPVVPPDTWRRLRKLARNRPAGEPIFVSLRKDKRLDDYRALTPGGVFEMVQTLGREAGLRQSVHPHLFRHSYATEAVIRGMHPTMLRQILGHSSTRMIDLVYANLVTADHYAAAMKIFGGR